MDKFLETYSPPKLNEKEIENKRPITRGETENVKKTTKKKNTPTPCKQKFRLH